LRGKIGTNIPFFLEICATLVFMLTFSPSILHTALNACHPIAARLRLSAIQRQGDIAVARSRLLADTAAIWWLACLLPLSGLWLMSPISASFPSSRLTSWRFFHK
jgi:hypothetical protein